MIDIQPWMKQAVSSLQNEFGKRLLFVGLQGSRRRKEAREDSDIDILTILDTMDVHDLAAYRRILRSLPEGDKAGGFTCGREELLAWPPHEIFQFAQDTEAYYGELAPLLPPFTREDSLTGARAGVSGLHHFTAYLYISGEADSRASGLEGVYKSFFFSMQLVHYLRSGVYARSKGELLSMLSGDEAELLLLGLDSNRYAQLEKTDPDALFQLMLTWTGNTLRELARLR